MDKSLVKFRIAVATSDGIVINQHFGKAKKFRIYDVNEDDTIDYKEERVLIPICQGGVHDEKKMQENIEYFTDCKYVLASRIGQGAVNALERAGVQPVELPGVIEESIQRLVSYDKVQELFE